MYAYYEPYWLNDDELEHFGIKGMKWGVRNYQNPDGTLTTAGKQRYGSGLIKGSIEKLHSYYTPQTSSQKEYYDNKYYHWDNTFPGSTDSKSTLMYTRGCSVYATATRAGSRYYKESLEGIRNHPRLNLNQTLISHNQTQATLNYYNPITGALEYYSVDGSNVDGSTFLAVVEDLERQCKAQQGEAVLTAIKNNERTKKLMNKPAKAIENSTLTTTGQKKVNSILKSLKNSAKKLKDTVSKTSKKVSTAIKGVFKKK